MARIVSNDVTPTIILNLNVIHTDGSIIEKHFSVDDMVGDLRYVHNKQISNISGRVAEITYKASKTKRLYSNIAKLRSYFGYDVEAESIIIDSSTTNHSVLTEIPVKELLEDADDTGVEKITTSLSYGFKSDILMSDGTNHSIDVMEGQILKNIVYLSKGTKETIESARLVVINHTVGTVNPTVLELNVDGKLKEVSVVAIVNIGYTVDPVASTASLADAITNSTNGNVFLSEGTFTEALTIEKSINIVGNKAGINAAKSTRDKKTFVGETVLSGAIKVSTGASVSLDGVVLTGDALMSISSASSVELKNCIITKLEPTTKKTMFFSIPKDSDPVTVITENCYFGAYKTDNGRIYNLYEMSGKIKNGSKFVGNYFQKGSEAHNGINIYDVEEGAVITIEDNIWEYSAQGIRIGTKGDVKCTININNNEYKDTLAGTYCGLLIVQPYASQTTSMANVTINLNKTKRYDKGYIYYLYSGGTDMQFTEENAPTMIVDGVKQEALHNYVRED